MKVVRDRPPNFDRIATVFPVHKYPGAIYAYGDTIYNPSGNSLSAALHAHEEVHSERQGGDPEAWWERYLVEPAFRLAEEIPAHRAEWEAFCKMGFGRGERRRYLAIIAGRLASPLYGHLTTFARAREIILAGA